MTRDEAIKILKGIREEAGAYEEAVCYVGSDEDIEALDMAIEALQTDIVYCYECKYNDHCCQCVDIIDDLLSLNFCSHGKRKKVKE